MGGTSPCLPGISGGSGHRAACPSRLSRGARGRSFVRCTEPSWARLFRAPRPGAPAAVHRGPLQTPRAPAGSAESWGAGSRPRGRSLAPGSPVRSPSRGRTGRSSRPRRGLPRQARSRTGTRGRRDRTLDAIVGLCLRADPRRTVISVFDTVPDLRAHRRAALRRTVRACAARDRPHDHRRSGAPSLPAWLTDAPGGGTSSSEVRASCPPAGRRRGRCSLHAASTRRHAQARLVRPLRARPPPRPRAQRQAAVCGERPELLGVDLAATAQARRGAARAGVSWLSSRRRDHRGCRRAASTSAAGSPEPASSAGLCSGVARPARHSGRFYAYLFSPSPILTTEGLVIHDLVEGSSRAPYLARARSPADTPTTGLPRPRAASSLEESQRAEGAGLWHPTGRSALPHQQPERARGLLPPGRDGVRHRAGPPRRERPRRSRPSR